METLVEFFLDFYVSPVNYDILNKYIYMEFY